METQINSIVELIFINYKILSRKGLLHANSALFECIAASIEFIYKY